MKNLIRTCAFAALLAVPAFSYAQDTVTPKPGGPTAGVGMMANCPFADTSGMQRDLGSMMSQMQGMMNVTKDPGMKQRMQQMHEHMSAMMANMQQMRGAMMGRGMMGSPQSGNAAPATPETAPSTAPEDPHHPEQ